MALKAYKRHPTPAASSQYCCTGKLIPVQEIESRESVDVGGVASYVYDLDVHVQRLPAASCAAKAIVIFCHGVKT
ncbi:MAG: hypothetical protein WCJ45_02435 [bacterium]